MRAKVVNTRGKCHVGGKRRIDYGDIRLLAEVGKNCMIQLIMTDTWLEVKKFGKNKTRVIGNISK